MISPGQTLENPVTGERFTFTDTAASSGGELLAFDFALPAGGAVTIPHVHPIQTERFEVDQRSRPARLTRTTSKGIEMQDLTLVIGGTGKTGRRIAQRLEAQGRPVRVGSRAGEPPFDWVWSAA